MTKQPIGVFISGRGTNLQSIINASKNESFPCEVKIVISDNHSAKGINIAKENGIDAFSLEIKDFGNFFLKKSSPSNKTRMFCG